MHIIYQVGGGLAYFPGLVEPRRIDVDNLSQAERGELLALVHGIDFFELPTQVNQPPAHGADYQKYMITIEDETRTHTVHFSDPVPTELAPLVASLGKLPSTPIAPPTRTAKRKRRG